MTDNNSLVIVIIRVPKSESAFTYFQLEANEGLCFYSTLESSLQENYRDLELKIPLCFKDEVFRLLNKLQEEFSIEILSETTINEE